MNRVSKKMMQINYRVKELRRQMRVPLHIKLIGFFAPVVRRNWEARWMNERRDGLK